MPERKKLTMTVLPDEEANLIRATIIFESVVTEVSTLTLSCAKQDGQLFLEWKAMLEGAVNRLIERMGGEDISSFYDYELN